MQQSIIKGDTKYDVRITSRFKKSLKNVLKSNKDIVKLHDVIMKLANDIELEDRYKNHKLVNSKDYYNCYECHIEPDWLLVYRKEEDSLILVLVDTGSHSNLF